MVMSVAEILPVSSSVERVSGFRQRRECPSATDRPLARPAARDTMPTIIDEIGGPPAQVTLPKDRCVLTVLSGPDTGKMFQLRGPEVTVGRNAADVQLDDPLVSRRHARFYRCDGRFYLEDLGSSNGTYRGGEQVVEPTLLLDGDLVGLGRKTLLRVALLDKLSERALLAMYEASLVDGLTGAYNRRYFDSRLDTEIAFASRHGQPLAVILLDIDEFKHINDERGHDVGDRVLRVIAASIRRIIRPGDVLARYGGDEFVVLARALDARNAETLAERIRRAVERACLRSPAGILRATLSIGVASRLPSSNSTRAEMIRLADRAMYRAKAAGRNRVFSAIAN
jgi:two-component system, cell cycle response regulator